MIIKEKCFLLISSIHVKSLPPFPNLTGLLVLIFQRLKSPESEVYEVSIQKHSGSRGFLERRPCSYFSHPLDGATHTWSRLAPITALTHKAIVSPNPSVEGWDGNSPSITPSRHLDTPKLSLQNPKHSTGNSTVQIFVIMTEMATSIHVA